MVIPYRTAKLKSAKMFPMAIWDPTAKFNSPLIITSGYTVYRTVGRRNYVGPHSWRRAAYLNMSDLTQTCPLGWELITTPRRSCARPSIATYSTCYSHMFPTQGIQYAQVYGRIIGYQIGETRAHISSEGRTIDQRYVDGVSLTYGNSP